MLYEVITHYVPGPEIPNTQISQTDTFGTFNGGSSISKTYDFGSGHANQTVTISVNVDVYNPNWEEGSDQFTINAQGSNTVSQTVTNDGTITFDVQLDRNNFV